MIRWLVALSFVVAGSAYAKTSAKKIAKKPFRSYRVETFAAAETTALTSRGPAGKPTRDRVDPKSFFEKINRTMLECPARLWPDYDWKKLQVVLLRPQQRTSWLWKGRDRSVTEIDNSKVPQRSFEAMYDFFELDGVSSMSVQLDSENGPPMDATTLFRVAVHEFFHITEQGGWTTPKDEKRGTAYPLEARARFVRFMLFDRLFRYFLDSKHDENFLALASHWYAAWKSEFPAEAANNTDVSEGTARYLDLAAFALAETGCAADDAKVYSVLQKTTLKELGGAVTSGQYDLAAEGYDLGAVASLIHRFVKKTPKWQERASQGINPLETLLASVTPISENGDPGAKAKIEREIVGRNRQIGAVVDSVLPDLARKDVVRVSVSNDWLPANFSPLFDVIPKAYPGWTAVPMAADMRLSAGATDLRTKRGTVYFENQGASPCGDVFILLIPADKLAKDKNSYVSSDGRAAGRFRGEAKKDSLGFDWICGK